MAPKTIRQALSDGWANLLTGLGTSRDRSRYTRFVEPCEREPSELTAIYRYNWLARRVVDGLPARALARGTTEAKPWPDAFTELNYARWDEGAFLRACSMGRLYGGAGLLIGYAGGGEDLTTPAPTAGGVAFLDVVTRHELSVAQRPEGGEWRDADPRSPTYQRPLVWRITGQHRLQGLQIHTSRFIWFGGASRPPQVYGSAAATHTDGARAADPHQDWSDSVLFQVWDDVERYGRFWQSMGQLVDVASVGVLKQKGLFEALGQESQDTMRRRVDLLNMGLSSARLLLLDSEHGEDYHREPVAFGGLPELSQEQQLAVAGAVGMPVTELFGRSPAGMNATGESDAQMWIDRVTQYRETVLQPRANALASAIAGSPVEVEFPPVDIPSEKEAAELRALEVATDEKLWTMQVVSAQEIRKARRNEEWVELSITTDAPPEPEPATTPTEPADGDQLAGLRGLRTDEEDDNATIIRLFRAAKDDYVGDQTSFAPDRETAEAYLDNPSFGGPELFETEVEILDSQILDIFDEDDQVKALREALGFEDQGAITIDAYLAQPKVADALKEQGISWVRLKDNFPEDAETFTFLSGGPADDPELMPATHTKSRKRRVRREADQTGPRGGRFYTTSGGTKVYK